MGVFSVEERVEQTKRTIASIRKYAPVSQILFIDNSNESYHADLDVDFETFFAKAPAFHPHAALIKGVVCGVRVEEVEDPLMRKIRYLDKLIDELAKGKAMEKILR